MNLFTRSIVRCLGLFVFSYSIGHTEVVAPNSASTFSKPDFVATLPLVDLSNDAERRVTVDRQAGQYLGHPTTVLLADGKTMFAVYPMAHAHGILVLKRSNDGGLTWSERLPVPENWKTSVNPPCIFRLSTPEGKERLIVLTGSRERAPEDYPIRMASSDDGGENWTPLRPLGDGPEYNAIVAGSSMVRLKDGRYMALQHSMRLPSGDSWINMKLCKMLSSDGGLTWSPRTFFATHPTARFCEPGAVRSPDGNQIAVLIRDNSRLYHSFITFSDDEGETWSTPHEVPLSLTGDRHVAKYAPDGRLVVVFRDMDKTSPTRGHFVAWVGTYGDLVDGRAGQYRIKLIHSYAGPDCGYAGLEVLSDGTFVATTYIRDRNGPDDKQSIISVRFKLSETDRLQSSVAR